MGGGQRGTRSLGCGLFRKFVCRAASSPSYVDTSLHVLLLVPRPQPQPLLFNHQLPQSLVSHLPAAFHQQCPLRTANKEPPPLPPLQPEGAPQTPITLAVLLAL